MSGERRPPLIVYEDKPADRQRLDPVSNDQGLVIKDYIQRLKSLVDNLHTPGTSAKKRSAKLTPEGICEIGTFFLNDSRPSSWRPAILDDGMDVQAVNTSSSASSSRSTIMFGLSFAEIEKQATPANPLIHPYFDLVLTRDKLLYGEVQRGYQIYIEKAVLFFLGDSDPSKELIDQSRMQLSKVASKLTGPNNINLLLDITTEVLRQMHEGRVVLGNTHDFFRPQITARQRPLVESRMKPSINGHTH